MSNTFRTVATAIAAAACLAACSSSGGDHQHTSAADPPAATNAPATSAAPATTAPATTAPATTAPATSSKATANTLSVTAYDDPTMRYAISGHPHAGLVTITFKNSGDAAHEMTLARLKPGVTLAKFKAALHKPNPESAANALVIDPHGEITGPQIVGPGLAETATVPLRAAHYVVICFLPGPHGMPHALMGMVADMTVAPGAASTRPPATDGTIALTDHKIALPANVAKGGTFAVTNRGTKPHDVSFARLKGAPLPSYFQCVAGSFGKGTPIDRCPGTLAGGITSLPAGQTVYLELAPFAKGSYGYVSTAGDGADFKAGLNGTFRA